MTQKWTAASIPDQTGRIAIVTGANSGTGFAACQALAAKGATVVMACRSKSRGQESLDRIKSAQPNARVELRSLDLADLASVRSFAQGFIDSHPHLDLLLNNAGIMGLPQARTQDGFELQFGTNHLGHFVLTSLLLDRLKSTSGSRVVTMTSLMHAQGKIDLDDLNFERRKYDKWKAYSQSKLANILFGLELQRRLHSKGLKPQSLVAHPGVADTNLIVGEARAKGSAALAKLSGFIGGIVGQPADRAALPMLFAATDPAAEGGRHYGPDGFKEMRGYPTEARSSRAAQDAQLAEALWRASEQLTGVSYNF